MGDFKYNFSDFLLEKEFGLREWTWLSLAAIYGILVGWQILLVIIASIYPAYLIARRKRKQYFDAKHVDWKSIPGVLMGANAALIFWAASIWVMVDLIKSAVF